MDILTALISLILIIIVYYFFVKSDVNIFDKHGIPYLKPWPLFGNMGPSLFKKIAMVHYVQKVYNLNDNAKYVGFFDFGSPTIIIRDTELIKSIAIKNFDHFVNHRGFVDTTIEPLFSNNLFSLHDEKWRQMRNILTPAFTSSKMKGMFKLMSNCAEIFSDYLVESLENNNSIVINSKDAFCRYTNDVIASCAFGITINSMKHQDNEFYVLGKKSTNLEGVMAIKLFLLRSFPILARLFKIRIFGNDVYIFFSNIIEQTVRMRDENNINRPDMIQLMMETRNNKSGPNLSIGDMTSQAFSFFFGGFDTTSSLMCFVVHEIAANPEIQLKLQNEIDDIFDKCNGDVTYEAVNGLEYLDAVINETLRYYPIAGFLDRKCTKNFELPPTLPGEKPLVVKPGDFIWFPVYPLQRDEKYFNDPDKFYPERFIEDPKGTLHSPAYMPFGVGPRMCIGNRFALLETKVLIVHLIAKCKLKPAEKMIMPLQLSKKSFAMNAEGGFWLDVEARNKWPGRTNIDK
ncbi:hypothetical protein HCN44_006590 [Aphidius gifuensis]|uniref:Cytochrome P450 n=1 Tax=Aphidius gifuensis TaxID=684658 RepID=A0A834Y0F4_APHGI|nr:cytochrome P450 9e2-like [Aphidius gifuensis]KAF7995483.1 hypothetical protein HCN44_006590 [Aphidius gifuensis]